MIPDFKKFVQLAKTHNLVPVWTELFSDLDTPVTVYLKLNSAIQPRHLASNNWYGILLESVEGGEKIGRYSFISVSHLLRFEAVSNHVRIIRSGKTQTFQVQDSFSELKKIFSEFKAAAVPELPPFCGGAVGMAGYDIIRTFEKMPDLLQDDLNVPDAVFLFTDECVMFDHWKHRMFLIKWNLIEDRSLAGLKRVYQNAEQALERLTQQIQEGKISQRFDVSSELRPPPDQVGGKLFKKGGILSLPICKGGRK